MCNSTFFIHYVPCNLITKAVVEECKAIEADGCIVTAHKVDVSCRKEVAEFVKKSMAEHNEQCHLLFNNAGKCVSSCFIFYNLMSSLMKSS